MAMHRRTFFKLAGAGAATALGAPQVWAKGATKECRLVTAWSPGLDVFQDGVNRFVARVEELTEGTLLIRPFWAGELEDPLDVFDAVSQGRAEMGHATPYYWADRVRAAQWFTSVPFGMDKNGINAWLYGGNGMNLWNEAYAEHGLVPLPMGDTGAQMFGWFRKEIHKPDDLAALRLRFPGLAGKVLSSIGADVVLLPEQGLADAFLSGALDGVNWIGPHHDLLMGLGQGGAFYYGPGWQEPSGRLELMISSDFFASLSTTHQAAVRAAAAEEDLRMQAQFDRANARSLETLQMNARVRVQTLSEQFLNKMWNHTVEILESEAAADPLSTRIYEDYKKVWQRSENWAVFSRFVM